MLCCVSYATNKVNTNKREKKEFRMLEKNISIASDKVLVLKCLPSIETVAIQYQYHIRDFISLKQKYSNAGIFHYLLGVKEKFEPIAR